MEKELKNLTKKTNTYICFLCRFYTLWYISYGSFV